MRVLFLTLYPETMPSSRLRVYQYLPFLKDQGISYTVSPAVAEPLFSFLYFSKSKFLKALYCLAELVGVYSRIRRARHYDVILVQKGLVSSNWLNLDLKLKNRARRVIYDIDDDVLGQFVVEFGLPSLRRRQDQDQTQKLARLAQTVIVGNRYLQTKALTLNSNVVVLPTPVDAERFCPSPQERSKSNEIVIGWIGMEIGMNYLRNLTPVFKRLASRYPIRLKVISRLSAGEDSFVLPGVKTDFVRWDYATEVFEMRSFDVGIMPLLEDEWGPGKCGLKLLQYMSMGIASVASRVGANCEIVDEGKDAFLAGSHEEWEEKLACLIESPVLRLQMGQTARLKVIKRYSLNALAPRWVEVLKSKIAPERLGFAAPLKITYVLPQMDRGGAETHVVRLVEGLRRRGHDARILCVFEEGKLAETIREKGIPIDSLQMKRWGWAVLPAIRKHLVNNPCQILHTYLFGLHLFAGLPARQAKIPHVVSSRRDVELSQPRKILWIEKIGNFFCDHVVACSQAVKTWVLGRENLKEEKITTLYNGVNLTGFVSGQGRLEARKEFSIPAEAFVIGTVANFSYKKGYKYFIEAAERVLLTQPNSYFLLVGAGPLEDEMKQKAALIPLGGRLIFTGARKDVACMLSAMDIFLFMSLWEGLPNVVLEAMAMKLPVISTAAGGVPEVITDGINGRIIPYKDSETAAEVIQELMADADLRERLGRAARQKIEMDFSLERMVCEYENFYRGLLQSNVETSVGSTVLKREGSVQGEGLTKQPSAVAEVRI